jgi:pyruvate,water dikinase
MSIDWLKNVGIKDIDLVGGKNASLGEMYQNLSHMGILVPNAFIVTTIGYSEFLQHNNLNNIIKTYLKSINKDDLISLRRVGLNIRLLIQNGEYPEKIKDEIIKSYKELSNQYINVDGKDATDVAVRSSSTAQRIFKMHPLLVNRKPI